jgi:hypothetical protein
VQEDIKPTPEDDGCAGGACKIWLVGGARKCSAFSFAGLT